MPRPSMRPSTAAVAVPEATSDVKYTPTDLFAWSVAHTTSASSEAKLEPGDWLHASDAVYAEVGERVVEVFRRVGTDLEVRGFYNPNRTATVKGGEVAKTARFGATVYAGSGSEAQATVVLPTTRSGVGYLQAITESDTGELRVVSLPAREPYTNGKSRWLISTCHSAAPLANSASAATLKAEVDGERVGCFVRHGMVDGCSEVGPGLATVDFTKVASFTEPCLPRLDSEGNRVVNDFRHVDRDDKRVRGGVAVLCDFAGGATLWIYHRCLVDNPLGFAPRWSWSRDWARRPPTEHILLGSPETQTSLEPSLAELSKSLPPAESPRALPASESKDHMYNHLDMVPPKRGDVLVVDESYNERLKSFCEFVQKSWTTEELDREDVRDELSELDHTPPIGAYEVRAAQSFHLPDGMLVVTVKAAPVGVSPGPRYLLVAGFTRPLGGQLAVRSEPTGGVVARVAKGAASKTLELAKDVAVGAKDHAVEAVTRKGTSLAATAGGQAALAGHEGIRRTIGAAVGAAVGAEDPAAFAASAKFVQPYNFAAVEGMRISARVLGRLSPKLADLVTATADSLEKEIDRKESEKVLEAVAPVVGAGLKALGQAALARVLPALGAPASAPAPAIPEKVAAAEQVEAKPKRSPRARKPKTTTSAKDGGAK